MHGKYALYVEGRTNIHAEVEVYGSRIHPPFPEESYVQYSIRVDLFLGHFDVGYVYMDVPGSQPKDWMPNVNYLVDMCWETLQEDARVKLEEALALVSVIHPDTLVFSSDIDSCARLEVPLNTEV